FMLITSMSHAQDTLTFWNGSKKTVHITRMDRSYLFYRKRSDTKREFAVDKEKLMHVGSRDSVTHWERMLFDKSQYGNLPAGSLEIDRLAKMHVDYFYRGDKVFGRRALFTTIIGTPLVGLGYCAIQGSKNVAEDQLGFMQNPHSKNTIYNKSYARYAKRKNQKKIWGNYVAGTLVYAIPIGIGIIAVQSMSMSMGMGSGGW
ncbi:MAG: hypothetical protein ACKOYC_07045, partial [Bacteroidota bacterium]